MAYSADDMIRAANVMGNLDKELNNQYRYGEHEDGVNHPLHYNKGIEVIDFLDSWNFNFNLGNVIAYTARCEYKGNKKKDLEKAIWYLEREIERESVNNE